VFLCILFFQSCPISVWFLLLLLVFLLLVLVLCGYPFFIAYRLFWWLLYKVNVFLFASQFYMPCLLLFVYECTQKQQQLTTAFCYCLCCISICGHCFEDFNKYCIVSLRYLGDEFDYVLKDLVELSLPCKP